MNVKQWRGLRGLRLAAAGAAALAAAWLALAQPQLAPAPVPQTAVPEPSPDARQAYQAARDKLVQIRTLRRQTHTQSSTGSGFYVSSDGLVVSNYHVVSQLALEPERHRLLLVSVDGRETPAVLLGFDVLHDLALLRALPAEAGATDSMPNRPEAGVQAPSDASKTVASMPPVGTPPPNAAASGAAVAVASVALPLRPGDAPLVQGERIYSLGNPLDVGFAITEGTYNGLVQRSFYPRIFFGGALNPGMSGGPALDTQGRVVGVNVAKRVGAEQVSFLVPVAYVQALLERARGAAPLKGAAHAEVARQLHLHQQALVQRLLEAPPRFERYGAYRVPVPDTALARCWGDGRQQRAESLYDYERSQCRIDSEVFTGEGEVGGLSLRYEAYDAPRLSPWQFAHLYGRSFGAESLRERASRVRTTDECREDFVSAGHGLPLRAVMCLSAYRKFSGLYDLTLLVASVDQPQRGILGRLNASGLSLDNAQRLAAHTLQAIASQPAGSAAAPPQGPP